MKYKIDCYIVMIGRDRSYRKKFKDMKSAVKHAKLLREFGDNVRILKVEDVTGW